MPTTPLRCDTWPSSTTPSQPGADRGGMDFTGEADGKAAPVKESLARQGSIYALTLDEFQSTLGGLGKEFGSMNMDDLLKSIWTAEEGFAMAVVGCDNGSGAAGRGLPRQGSLTLPRTLSMKTVDEVWRDLIVDSNAAAPSSSGQAPTTGVVARQPTLGEMTLEEFLVRAGVVREELIATPAPTNPQVGAGLLFDEMPTAAGNYRGLALGFSQADQSGGGMVNAAIPRGSDANLGLDMGLMTGVVGLATAGVAAAKVSPPSHLGSDMLGKGNGDMSSPVPYLFGGGMRGRKCSGSVEKVVERRQRRMIKNRESAARSRARKQAYTMELEAEVAKLKEQNEELQRKQAELIEMQKNQDLHMLNQHHGQKKPCLRRTQTGPW